MSFLDSGKAITSTTTQKPTTTHLVQLPAGISASFLIPFIDSLRFLGGQHRSSGPPSPMPAIRRLIRHRAEHGDNVCQRELRDVIDGPDRLRASSLE